MVSETWVPSVRARIRQLTALALSHILKRACTSKRLREDRGRSPRSRQSSAPTAQHGLHQLFKQPFSPVISWACNSSTVDRSASCAWLRVILLFSWLFTQFYFLFSIFVSLLNLTRECPSPLSLRSNDVRGSKQFVQLRLRFW